MTPKQKAKELVSNYEKILKLDYKNYYKYNFEHCRKCALIAVDELMGLAKKYETKNCRLLMDNLKILYWQEVKREIEKL